MQGYDFAAVLDSVLDEMFPCNVVGAKPGDLLQQVLVRLVERLKMSCPKIPHLATIDCNRCDLGQEEPQPRFLWYASAIVDLPLVHVECCCHLVLPYFYFSVQICLLLRLLCCPNTSRICPRLRFAHHLRDREFSLALRRLLRSLLFLSPAL